MNELTPSHDRVRVLSGLAQRPFESHVQNVDHAQQRLAHLQPRHRLLQCAAEIHCTRRALVTTQLLLEPILAAPALLFTGVSAVEHCREDDDTQAMQEIAGVLKPRGRAVLTLEFGPEFVDWSPVVQGRIYDEAALIERLVKPSGLEFLGPRDYESVEWNETDVSKKRKLSCPAALVLVKPAP